MSAHDNDTLSRFFRKALQKPEIEFVEGDWKRLDARLTAEASNTSNDHPGKTWLASTVGLLILAYLLTTPEDADKIQLESFSRIHDSSAVNMSHSRDLSATGQPASSSTRLLLTATNAKSYQDQSRPGIQAAPSQKQVQGTTDNEEVTQFASALSLPPVALVNDTTQRNDTIQQLSLMEKFDTIQAELLSDSNVVRPNRWAIVLAYAPDFSSTRLHKLSAPGESFGMSAQFRVTPSLSILAGIVGSTKNYQDNGTEYKPREEHYWAKHTNGIMPTVVQGQCEVLEFPIGVQFVVARQRKTQLSIAGQLSSYVMLHESYDYHFKDTNPGAASGWKSKEVTYFPLSVVNVSANYEYRISARTALGLSPYIKAPLTGIGGWSSIKLYTVGAAFTFRYNFGKGKHPPEFSAARHPDG